MKLLVLGGTGFLGRYVVRGLCNAGHDVTVFHRGQTTAEPPPGVHALHGDRRRLGDFADEFRRLAPDVVLDVIPYAEAEGAELMRVFRGVAHRVVALSSGDVYRAYDRFRGVVAEPPEPGPLTEDAPLRESLYPYRAQASGPDDMAYHYEKILVERAVLGDPRLPGTVLRLPMVYGPGDRQHRLFLYLKRMDDGRPAILLEENQARWRWTRGYVENVAAAVARTATEGRAASRVYNIGEADAPTEAQWVEQIGRVVGWQGEVVALPGDLLPKALTMPVDWRHHLATDTSRLRNLLGFTEPVARAEALRRTVEWERAHPPAFRPEQFDYAAEDAALAAWRGRGPT
jgi:nucleoside-diphosphate-sugar epimerase